MFTQMLAKNGAAKFGVRAVPEIVKEYKQLALWADPSEPIVQSIDYKYLTKEDIKRALEAVNLIKEKRDRKFWNRWYS